MYRIPTESAGVGSIAFLTVTHLLAIPKAGPGIILTTDTDELIQIAWDRLKRDFTEEEGNLYNIERCATES